MAFNHDSFVASANYLALDASLQWYLDTVGPQVATLESLAKKNVPKLKLLYQNDPVMQKLVKISNTLEKITREAKG